jgi:HPt (histidine-containing phosphotransfer) domain-containing protein
LQLGLGLMPLAPGQVRLDDLLRVCSSDGGQTNRGLLQEMLMLFIQENERRVDAAVVAADEGDGLALRGAMHAVKGSAALIGAERLRDLAGDCELRIISGTLNDPPACARQLRDEYAAVVSTLKSLYPDLCARSSS